MTLALSLLTLWSCGEKECSSLSSGTYRAAGSCFGTEMTVELAFADGQCSFALSGWSPNLGGPPELGELEGTAVTLSGGYYEGCTGDLVDGSLSGTCPDGCAWELVPQGG